MADWIQSNGFVPVILATKADKLNRSQIPRQIKLVREGLGLEKGSTVIPFSSVTKQGREEIWALIEQMMLKEEEPEEIGRDPKKYKD